MADLEQKLQEARGTRFKLIATDGVFSMDGTLANLPDICELADKHAALVMVDDSHAVGFMGPRGRGTHEHHGVWSESTSSPARWARRWAAPAAAITSGRAEIVQLLRQRSRPYLFSNSVAPMIVATSLAVLEMLGSSTELRDRLEANTRFFRERMTAAGFKIVPGTHPIVPIMLGDAALATQMADRLLEKGVYVIGFSYPVVPQGKARIRVQVSAAHTREDLSFAVEAFTAVKRELSV